jgi:two-component system LytT family response regulator
MGDRRVTTLIADDEPLALQRLRLLLGEIPWIALVGEAADGAAAVRAIDALEPDLVFLDVVMPDATGLEVLNRITHRPTVVFTTAYDKFAVAAFEARALDYLLKPFGRRRLVATLDRVRESMRPGAPLDWLFVREHGRVTPIKVDAVIRFEGSDDYVSVHTTGRTVLAALQMSELERQLPPGFIRVHRSHIVNLAMVDSFVAHEGARYTVVLRDGTRLAVSRDRARWLRGRAI